MAVKTDNRSLADKVELRRRLLSLAGFAELRVLDLCAGEGHIWNRVGRFANIAAYVPCDREPRMEGVIKGEANRLIDSFDLSRFNVVDIDTYGSPWEIWFKAAKRIRQPTAVFLTHGITRSPGGTTTSTFDAAVMGIPAEWHDHLPRKLALAEFAAGYCLGATLRHCRVHHALQIALDGVTYYGLLCDGLPQP